MAKNPKPKAKPQGEAEDWTDAQIDEMAKITAEALISEGVCRVCGLTLYAIITKG